MATAASSQARPGAGPGGPGPAPPGPEAPLGPVPVGPCPRGALQASGQPRSWGQAQPGAWGYPGPAPRGGGQRVAGSHFRGPLWGHWTRLMLAHPPRPPPRPQRWPLTRNKSRFAHREINSIIKR